MKTANKDILSSQKIRALLAAIGSRPAEADEKPIEVQPYDWNQSRYFNRKQLTRLQQFAEQVASATADRLAGIYHTVMEVELISLSQHFASDCISSQQDAEQELYYLAFGEDVNQPAWGTVAIPAQSAAALIMQLLGDNQAEPTDSHQLSRLEQSLLSDIAAAVVGAIASCLSQISAVVIGSVGKTHDAFEPDPAEDLCKITLRVKQAGTDSASELVVLMLSQKLNAVAGAVGQNTIDSAGQQAQQAILAHLHQMPICIRARLAQKVLTFQQVMDLEVGDVVVLSKPIDEPVELLVDDRVVLRGWPAQSQGRYAVVVSETAAGRIAHQPM